LGSKDVKDDLERGGALRMTWAIDSRHSRKNDAKNRPRVSRNLKQFSYQYVDLPEGSFHTNTLGLRMFYFFSTDLYLKAYVQWNDDKYYNAGKEKVVNDILLRWIYSPACNLYLVYNDGRLIGPGNNEIINRTLMVKVTYFWRK